MTRQRPLASGIPGTTSSEHLSPLPLTSKLSRIVHIRFAIGIAPSKCVRTKTPFAPQSRVLLRVTRRGRIFRRSCPSSCSKRPPQRLEATVIRRLAWHWHEVLLLSQPAVNQNNHHHTLHSEDQITGMEYRWVLAWHHNVDGRDSDSHSRSVGKMTVKGIGWKASNSKGRI